MSWSTRTGGLAAALLFGAAVRMALALTVGPAVSAPKPDVDTRSNEQVAEAVRNWTGTAETVFEAAAETEADGSDSAGERDGGTDPAGRGEHSIAVPRNMADASDVWAARVDMFREFDLEQMYRKLVDHVRVRASVDPAQVVPTVSRDGGSVPFGNGESPLAETIFEVTARRMALGGELPSALGNGTFSILAWNVDGAVATAAGHQSGPFNLLPLEEARMIASRLERVKPGSRRIPDGFRELTEEQWRGLLTLTRSRTRSREKYRRDYWRLLGAARARGSMDLVDQARYPVFFVANGVAHLLERSEIPELDELLMNWAADRRRLVADIRQILQP